MENIAELMSLIEFTEIINTLMAAESLWKALAVILGCALCLLLIHVIKSHMRKMDKMIDQFQANIIEIMKRDNAQDTKIENHEVRLTHVERNQNSIVKYHG